MPSGSTFRASRSRSSARTARASAREIARWLEPSRVTSVCMRLAASRHRPATKPATAPSFTLAPMEHPDLLFGDASCRPPEPRPAKN